MANYVTHILDALAEVKGPGGGGSDEICSGGTSIISWAEFEDDDDS